MTFPKNDIPVFQLTQPSTKRIITYRGFTVKESKQILLASNGSSQEMLLAMQSCVDNCTFNVLDVESLPNFDLEYIFLMIRAKSVGENIELTLTCKKCKEKEDYNLSILDVNVIYNPDHTKKILLSDKLGVIMKYPTTSQLDNLTLNYSTETVFNTVLDCIESVFDDKSIKSVKDETREELIMFVESLTTKQMEMIEKFFKTIPVLKHDFEHICSKCGENNKYLMVGLENFFA
jgi:hypothetical protein